MVILNCYNKKINFFNEILLQTYIHFQKELLQSKSEHLIIKISHFQPYFDPFFVNHTLFNPKKY